MSDLNKGWNFFILFQLYKNDNEILYDLILKEINALHKDTDIHFYVLKHIVKENKIEFYRTEIKQNNLSLTLVGQPVVVNDFYLHPFTDAKKAWGIFFNMCSDKQRKNFIVLYGHGAGLGFTPKEISGELDRSRLKDLFTNGIFDLEALMNDDGATRNHFEDKISAFTGLPFVARKLPIIPVSIFTSIISETLLSTQNKRVDFLCFANCFMQCIENGYILKDTINYLISTEGTYINPGINFPELYKVLDKKEDNESIARNITDSIDERFNAPEIIAYFEKNKRSIARTDPHLAIKSYFSISVNNLQCYEELKQKLSALALLILDKKNIEAHLDNIIAIRQNEELCRDVFSNNPIGIIDLSNFLYQVVNMGIVIESKTELNREIKTKCYELINFILHHVVVSNHFPAFAYRKRKGYPFGICPFGISVFFPGKKSKHTYDEIVIQFYDDFFASGIYLSGFLKNNKWKDFVSTIYNAPKRGFINLLFRSFKKRFEST